MNNKVLLSYLSGNIGKQLFNYAVGKSISKKCNMEHHLLYNYDVYISLYDSLFSKISYKKIDNIKDINQYKIITIFNNNIPDIEDKVIIYNESCCNDKLFKNIKDHLFNTLILPYRHQLYADYLYSNIKDKYRNKNLIFLHFNNSDWTNIEIYEDEIEFNWFEEAINQFDIDNSVFLIFIDKDRNNYYKNKFDSLCKYKEFYSKPNENHLYIMTKCNGGIISNSMSAWWGAYLGDYKENKTYISPKLWSRNMNHWKQI